MIFFTPKCKELTFWSRENCDQKGGIFESQTLSSKYRKVARRKTQKNCKKKQKTAKLKNVKKEQKMLWPLMQSV